MRWHHVKKQDQKLWMYHLNFNIVRFPHATLTSMKFKASELFTSGIFCLAFLDGG